MAYVQANGGGPTVPRDADGQIAQQSLIGDDVARGGDLFRLNCASCHNFTGKGGALSSGKYAPDLDTANPAQIYAAMLSGPQNMPKFSDRQLTPDEKKDIVAYIKMATDTKNPGGYGLGGFGPDVRGVGDVADRNRRRHRRDPVDRIPRMTAESPKVPDDRELAEMSARRAGEARHRSSTASR